VLLISNCTAYSGGKLKLLYAPYRRSGVKRNKSCGTGLSYYLFNMFIIGNPSTATMAVLLLSPLFREAATTEVKVSLALKATAQFLS